MNMLTRFSEVFTASQELSGNGAALVGFLGRSTKSGAQGRSQKVERRIRRRSRAFRAA